MRSGQVNGLAGAAIAAAILAGCTVGPDFNRPDPPAADRYTVAPHTVGQTPASDADRQTVKLGSALAEDWWRLFESDALNDIVRQALANNRSLASAAATLAAAREFAGAQAGSLYPKLSIGADIGRQKYGAEFLGTADKPPPFTYFSVGPTVSYALDYVGGIARSVEQGYALAEYEHQQMDAAYLSVTGNAVLLSFRSVSLQDQIAAVQSILDQDRENLKLVQVAFDAGSVSRIDILSAETQLASDATLLPPLRQELSMAQHALAVVLGQTTAGTVPSVDWAHVVLPKNLPVSLPSELAHRRPDILAAEAQLHAATAWVGMTTANLYPQIALNGSISMQSTVLRQLFNGANNAGGLTASLTAPLFDAGALRAKRRAAIAAVHAAAANYEQTVLTAFAQVADSLDALDHDAEQLTAQARAQAAARESLDLTRKSYNEGSVGVLQVLDAERLYQQARLGYVRANSQRYLDTAQLFLALGGSSPNPTAASASAGK
jgi:NodT family efflux transporter outer membrane factor (OMF) lipoprotein